MKKFIVFALAVTLAGGMAYANYCARDIVPASTILVPYAVVSMTGSTPDPQGYTTLLTITNVSKDAQIIHITVWNAVSKAVLDWDEVLSGYDMWTINFRDMLTGQWGLFDTSRSSTAYPNTGQREPFEWGPDGRSAYQSPPIPGKLPTPEKTSDTPSTGCSMPYGDMTGYLGLFVPQLLAPMKARTHLGCGTQTVRGDKNATWLTTLGANELFFYVTIDVVNTCNLDFPTTAGYFQNTYLNENVLIGDLVYMNANMNYSEALPAVHIETSPARYSFAASWMNFYEEKAASSDLPYLYLEPLATALAFRYQNDPAGSRWGIPMTSNIMLWKNFWEFSADLSNSAGNVNDCGAYMYYSWDEDEHVVTRGVQCPISPCGSAEIDPNVFPFETQMVPVTSANFDLPDKFGWMLVIFPPSYPASGYVDPTPNTTLLGRKYMAWGAYKFNYGTYSAAVEAATMANAHCFETQRLPNLGINYEYLSPVL